MLFRLYRGPGRFRHSRPLLDYQYLPSTNDGTIREKVLNVQSTPGVHKTTVILDYYNCILCQKLKYSTYTVLMLTAGMRG